MFDFKYFRDKASFLARDRYFWILLSIFLLGTFFRVYNFSPWLHFELDQARDLFIAYDSINKGTLPLLGPYARGSELYLGPAFYYFQIFSGYLFGISPATVAIPDLLFGIAFILLFYFFSRAYFSRKISILLLVLASTSLFLITYSRFAWNPNGLPFWVTLSLYSLLMTYRNKVFSRSWFLLSVGAGAIAMQLHFISFLAVPLIFISYILLAKVRPDLRSILYSILLFCIIFTPVIFSEYRTGAKNTKALFTTILDKNNKDEEHDLIEKIFRNTQETSTYYWVILSGNQSGGDNIRTNKAKQGYFPLICDKSCKNRLPYHFLAITFFIASGAALLLRARTLWKKKNKNTKNIDAKNGNLILIIWFFWGGIFLTLLAYQISPRFYLFLAPAFFILFGFLLDFLIRKFKKKGFTVSVLIVATLALANIFSTFDYLTNLDKATALDSNEDYRDIIMNRADIITIEQLRQVQRYIQANEEGSNENFLIIGENRYARPIFYLVNIESSIKNLKCYIKKSGFEKSQIKGSTFYLLVRKDSKKKVNDDMLEGHTVSLQEDFGSLSLYKLIPYNKNIDGSIPNGCFAR